MRGTSANGSIDRDGGNVPSPRRERKELPATLIVGAIKRADARALLVGPELDVEMVEAPVEAVAARLEIGFFQRPESEERMEPTVPRQPVEGRALGRREESRDDPLQVGQDAHSLHIDADVPVTRDDDERQLVRMGQVEPERGAVDGGVQHRLTPWSRGEDDGRRRCGQVARQDRA